MYNFFFKEVEAAIMHTLQRDPASLRYERVANPKDPPDGS